MRPASDAYAALDTAGAVKQHRAVTYRCRARGCVLLDVLRVPDGLLVVRPASRVGQRLHERYAIPARPDVPVVKWWAEAWPLERARVLVGCGHATASLSAATVEADMNRGHGTVVVLPRDGGTANALRRPLIGDVP